MLTGLGLQDGSEVAARGVGELRNQFLGGDAEQEWDDDEPSATTDSTGAWAAWCPQPEDLADGRPAQCVLLAGDEEHHEDELPDESSREAHDHGSHQRLGPIQLTRHYRADDPHEQAHRHRGGGPDGENASFGELSRSWFGWAQTLHGLARR